MGAAADYSHSAHALASAEHRDPLHRARHSRVRVDQTTVVTASRAEQLLRRYRLIGWQRLKAAGRTQYDDGLLVLVFRRRLDLIAGQFQCDDTALAGVIKMQSIPVDCDLAAADAEKAAEIDHSCAHLPRPVDNDIDDAPHILIGAAAHLLAENTLCLPRLEDSY